MYEYVIINVHKRIHIFNYNFMEILIKILHYINLCLMKMMKFNLIYFSSKTKATFYTIFLLCKWSWSKLIADLNDLHPNLGFLNKSILILISYNLMKNHHNAFYHCLLQLDRTSGISWQLCSNYYCFSIDIFTMFFWKLTFCNIFCKIIILHIP